MIFLAKIVGAVLVFALGIWIGLGMPGLGHREERRAGRLSGRLHGTWLNRLFFGMSSPPRRFDASRLVVPKAPAKKGGPARTADEESPEEAADPGAAEAAEG